MLYDDFRKEKMVALKEKDKLKNKVITNILSDLIYIKKELGQEPTEADSAKAVAKQVKQVKEAIEMSKDRPDKSLKPSWPFWNSTCQNNCPGMRSKQRSFVFWMKMASRLIRRTKV